MARSRAQTSAAAGGILPLAAAGTAGRKESTADGPLRMVAADSDKRGGNATGLRTSGNGPAAAVTRDHDNSVPDSCSGKTSRVVRRAVTRDHDNSVPDTGRRWDRWPERVHRRLVATPGRRRFGQAWRQCHGLEDQRQRPGRRSDRRPRQRRSRRRPPLGPLAGKSPPPTGRYAWSPPIRASVAAMPRA
jgi:hypothetical protein